MNISIIGTGAYGLALASMFLENKCNITMWTHSEDECEKLKNERKNLLPV